MTQGCDLGGDGYASKPVDIKACLDEMKAQSTERCEANFAPDTAGILITHRHSHRTSEEKQRSHLSRVLWVE